MTQLGGESEPSTRDRLSPYKWGLTFFDNLKIAQLQVMVSNRRQSDGVPIKFVNVRRNMTAIEHDDQKKTTSFRIARRWPGRT